MCVYLLKIYYLASSPKKKGDNKKQLTTHFSPLCCNHDVSLSVDSLVSIYLSYLRPSSVSPFLCLSVFSVVSLFFLSVCSLY